MSPTVLETPRLLVRPFDLDEVAVIHRILDQAFGDGTQIDDPAALAERRSWVQWSALSQEWLPRLHQPPYGDRAVVLKATGALIGAVGYVPCLAPFEQLPALRDTTQPCGYATPEVGLFWAIEPAQQRQGYATEAAQAMIQHAFTQLGLKRIIATTEYTNMASQGVMRKLGMQVLRNPLPEPHWLQVVGVLQNVGKS
jgi:[ribosomal protein S5]-alanine N-acetyltransferase